MTGAIEEIGEAVPPNGSVAKLSKTAQMAQFSSKSAADRRHESAGAEVSAPP